MRILLISLIVLITVQISHSQELLSPNGDVGTSQSSASGDIVIKSLNNEDDLGLSFQNSAGWYTFRMFREQVILNEGTPEEAIRYNLRFSGGVSSQFNQDLNHLLVIDYDGNIGIGTSNPAGRLHINGTNSIGSSAFILDNTGYGNNKLFENNRPFTIRRNYSDDESFHIHNSDNATIMTYKNDEAWGKIHFRMVNSDTENSDGSNANDNFVMTIAGNKNGGYVAIGEAAAPSGYLFSVDGMAIMEEVVVQLSEQWPDYVFKPEYKLFTLDQIKNHISEKGHLPNIPSAEEVSENGVSLGEMNRLLLEKVEELTLYMLEQNDQLKTQQNQINILTEEIQNLKNN